VTIFYCSGQSNASEILGQLIQSSIQRTFTRLCRNYRGRPERGNFLD